MNTVYNGRMSTFTDKQRLFIEHYLQSWNATEAAAAAGYKGNRVTLASVGYENLRKPHIARAVGARLAERAMTAEEALGRLAEQARGLDLLAYLDSGGRLDLGAVAGSGRSHLVRRVSFTRHGLTVEAYDAQRALELILRFTTGELLRVRPDVSISADDVREAADELRTWLQAAEDRED